MPTCDNDVQLVYYNMFKANLEFVKQHEKSTHDNLLYDGPRPVKSRRLKRACTGLGDNQSSVMKRTRTDQATKSPSPAFQKYPSSASQRWADQSPPGTLQSPRSKALTVIDSTTISEGRILEDDEKDNNNTVPATSCVTQLVHDSNCTHLYEQIRMGHAEDPFGVWKTIVKVRVIFQDAFMLIPGSPGTSKSLWLSTRHIEAHVNLVNIANTDKRKYTANTWVAKTIQTDSTDVAAKT